MLLSLKTSQSRVQLLLIGGLGLAIATLLSFGFLVSQHQIAKAGAPTCTWTGGGGDTNFSTAANWTCESGTVPADGTTLIFPVNVSNRTAINDLSGSLIFSGIEFNGACGGYGQGAYVISGTMRIAGDIADTSDVSCIAGSTISGIVLESDMTYQLVERNDIEFGSLNIGTHNLSITGNITDPEVYGFSVGFGSNSHLLGSGQIIVNGAKLEVSTYNTSETSFSGTITLSTAQLTSSKTNTASNWSLGTGTIKIGDKSGYHLSLPAGSYIFSNPIEVSGSSASSDINGDESARIGIESTSTQESDVYDLIGFYAAYRSEIVSGSDVTFNGAVTLSSDLTVLSNTQTTFSGALLGSGYSISSYLTTDPGNSRYGTLVISGSSNTTTTGNGSFPQTTLTTTTLANTDSIAVYIGNLNKVIINGVRGDVLIRYGGILSGSGTVGDVTSEGGKVATGNSPGILNSGNVSYDNASSMDVEIGGTTAGTGYDQLNVTGTVSLGSATLNISQYNDFIPELNDTFTIINNDGSDAVTGTFAGHAEGSTYTVGAIEYTISYVGGDGNDVILTATTTPGAPDTSGVLANPVSWLMATGVLVAGIGALLLSRQAKKTSKVNHNTAKK